MSGLSQAQSARLARSSALVLSANRFTGQLVRSICFGVGLQDVAVVADLASAEDRLRLSNLDLVVADSGAATYDAMPAIEVLRSLPDRRQAETPVILLATPGVSPSSGPDFEPLAEIQKPLSSKSFTDAILRLLFGVEPEDPHHPKRARFWGPATTLLLSSNPYTAQIVRSLLLPLGLTDLSLARDPAEADKALHHSKYDFLIVDSGPASFDSLGALERAKAHSCGRRDEAPALLLAADTSVGMIARAQAAEVKAIVKKPIDPSVFKERVKGILKLKAA